MSTSSLSRELLLDMLTRMLRIRLFEERVAEFAATGTLPGVVHLSIGQEATCVGTCIALAADDYMTGNHRSHGHPIAKGSDLRGLMAELFGKSTGVCKGKGGSMHLADFKVGSLGESGVVASAVPVAVGAALSAQVRGTRQVCVAFFGDGAVNQGVLSESLNFAAIWKLPVIFLCENNQYAVSTRASDVTGGEIPVRARAFGVESMSVDGQDVLAVFEAVRDAVARARGCGGATLVEAVTYRFREHAEGLPVSGYRTPAEVAEWKGRDPVALFSAKLIADGAATESELENIKAGVVAEVVDAVAFAESSPDPAPQDLFDDLYSSDPPVRTLVEAV